MTRQRPERRTLATWIVLEPERGALAGEYVGVQASAAAGPGAGANAPLASAGESA